MTVAVAIICFVNTLPNDFCYDDDLIVRHNPKVNAPGQWPAIWTTDHWYDTTGAAPQRDLLYRPVSLSSYRLVRLAGGDRPFTQHLVNVILHAWISLLVVRLGRYLGGSESAALVAGLVFAVLPVHTEAVAPVVGRTDLLATLGVLLALSAHRRLMAASARRHAAAWGVAAGTAAFVAMGSKESGVTVVALIVLLDVFWYREQAGLPRPRRWWGWPALRRLCYLAIPLVCYLALRYHALGGRLHQQPSPSKTVNVLVDAAPWQHALGVVQLWGAYWEKTVWPSILSVKYSINAIRLATSPLDSHVLIGAVAAIGLVAASIVCWRRGIRSVAFLSVAIGLSYLPAANAFVLIQVFFAERIWYLPSVWVAMLAALALGRLVRRPAWWIVVGVLVFGMTVRCWVRNAEWRDNGTLYAAAYRDQPDGVGPLQLYGQWLINHGQYDRGMELLERAIEIDLGFTDAHRALSQAHLRTGNLAAALRHLQIADMQAPGHGPTVGALARVSRELSERDEQLADLRRRADDTPGDVEAEIELLRRLRDLGLLKEALARFQQREDMFADNVTWQAEYAVTLVYLNKIDQAIERYRACLELDPDDPQRAVELAMLFIERRQGNDLEEARRWVEHASRFAPETPSVLACRAELSVLSGDVSGAVALYERAIHALPPNSDQRRVFEQRARTLGR